MDLLPLISKLRNPVVRSVSLPRPNIFLGSILAAFARDYNPLYNVISQILTSPICPVYVCYSLDAGSFLLLFSAFSRGQASFHGENPILKWSRCWRWETRHMADGDQQMTNNRRPQEERVMRIQKRDENFEISFFFNSLINI